MNETEDFEDADFYGIFDGFGNRAIKRRLELWGESEFKEGDLDAYVEETQEWRKRNYIMQISGAI